MFNNDNLQHKSDMGRIVAQSIGGIVIKLVIVAVVIYAIHAGYVYVSHVFDPISAALDGK